MGSSRSEPEASACSRDTAPSKASRPRPNRFVSLICGDLWNGGRRLFDNAWTLDSAHQLLGHCQVALGTHGLNIIQENGLPEARCLGEPHVPGNRCHEDLGAKVLLGILRHLPAKVQTGIVHGQEYTAYR